MQPPQQTSQTGLQEKRIFLAFVSLLLAVGALMVYSSGMTSMGLDTGKSEFKKQIIFLVIALSFASLAAIMPKSWWRKLAPVMFGATILLLIAVLIPGIGHRVNGAQRWLRFGAISFQPSETAKLTVPLLICWLSTQKDGSLRSTSFAYFFKMTFLVSIPLGLILIEPDLGTALFVAVGAAFCLFLCGLPWRYFLICSAAVIPAFLGLVALKPYQLARIRGFIQTWTNPEEAPYQIRQSLTTLGVGGMQGTGLGRGWQKLSFLPESNTDFIFSVIGEELGLLGTIGVVFLWLGLYLSGLRLIRLSECSFEATLGTTLLTQIVFQAALNVAVVTAMVPPKGISHPLISYGGSNLVTSLLAIGMIVSLTNTSETQPVPHPDTEFDSPHLESELLSASSS